MVVPMHERECNTKSHAMHSCIQADKLHRFITLEAGPRLLLIIMMAVHVHAGSEPKMQRSIRCDLGGRD